MGMFRLEGENVSKEWRAAAGATDNCQRLCTSYVKERCTNGD